MDQQLLRTLGVDAEPDQDSATGKGGPGKSSLTARLTPAPQVVFRVADPETARALGESLSGGVRARVMRDAETGTLGQRDANGVAAGADAMVDRAASSSGAPLPTHIQRQFEGSLGADLSAVRVHTGSDSAAAAHAVGAKAYTVGNDIHFAEGRYAPEDPFGMHLLAHEVAHTVQQSGGAQRRQHKLEVSTPHDAAEHEADRAADAMVMSRPFVMGATAEGLARKAGADGKAADPKEAKEKEEEEFPVGLSGLKIKGWDIPWPSKEEGISAQKEYTAQLPEKKEDAEKQFRQNFPAATLPGGIVAMGTVGASIAATASISVTGKLIDLPSGKKGATVSAAGGGVVEGKVYGQLDVGAYAGIPYLNAGATGYLKLEGSASIGAFVIGNATFGDGKWSGNVTLQVPMIAKVTGSGGIRLIYQLGEKTKEIKKWQIGGGVDLALFSCICTAVYDLNTGEVKDTVKTDMKLHDFGAMFAETPLTPEEKRKYARAQQAKELEGCEGGEGCGPGGNPEEMYSPDDPSPYEVPDAAPAPETPCNPENQSCLE